PTPIPTVSLHDALPISAHRSVPDGLAPADPSAELKWCQQQQRRCYGQVDKGAERSIPGFVAGSLPYDGVDDSIQRVPEPDAEQKDRKSTRLNSSHVKIS